VFFERRDRFKNERSPSRPAEERRRLIERGIVGRGQEQ